MIENVQQFWDDVRKLCFTLAEAGHQDWAGELANAFRTQFGVEQMAQARWVMAQLRQTSIPDSVGISAKISELIQFTDSFGEKHQIHWKEPQDEKGRA